MKSTAGKISPGYKIPINKMESSPFCMKNLFNTLHEGVFIYDLQEKRLFLNPAALEMHSLKSLRDVQNSLSKLFSLFEFLSPTGQTLTMSQWPFSRILRGESFSDLEFDRSPQGLGMGKILVFFRSKSF